MCSPRLAQANVATVVDSATAKKVRQGDFGTLRTLQDFYRRLSRRRRSSRGDRGPMLLEHRLSWPNHSEFDEPSEQQWSCDSALGGCSDSELAIDLSVHRDRLELQEMKHIRSPDSIDERTWDHLQPDEEYLVKSKSCGSSPEPSRSVYQNHLSNAEPEEVRLLMGPVVESGSRLPSPSKCSIVMEQCCRQLEALQACQRSVPSTSEGVHSCSANVFDEKATSAAADVMADSRLPLKKRRLHDVPTVPVEAIDKNIETTSTSRHSVENCTVGGGVRPIDDTYLVALKADEDGDLPLHIAVVHQELNVVHNVIRVMSLLGASLDQYNKLKQTPLHLAVLTGNVHAVRLLLSGGASPNVVDRGGLSAIHHATQLSSVDCLRCLIEESVCAPNLNAMSYDGLAPLHLAVRHGNLRTVHLLLRAGARVDATDGKNGRTALFYAVEHNDLRAAALLLENGADATLTTYSGCSPAQAAVASRCSTELLELLETYDSSCGGFGFQQPSTATCCPTG